MAVLELNFTILMCHNNKIENSFNINNESYHPFYYYYYFVVGVFSYAETLKTKIYTATNCKPLKICTQQCLLKEFIFVDKVGCVLNN